MNGRVGLIISLLFCLVLSSCVSRLPERAKLTPQAIPEQPADTGRVYVYMGNMYMKGAFGGTSESQAAGLDGEIYVNHERITYIGDQAVIIDLAPGTYKVHWNVYFTAQIDKDRHTSAPYDLRVESGDIIYLRADISDASLASSKWAGLAGAVGGVVEAMSMKFINYFEEDQQNGPKAISEAGIADYCDLSSKQIKKTSSI